MEMFVSELQQVGSWVELLVTIVPYLQQISSVFALTLERT